MGEVEADHLDDARAARVRDAIDLCVRGLGDFGDGVWEGTDVVPGECPEAALEAGVCGCVLVRFFWGL